ncbi:hypothetical protein, partial [Acetobacter malorum]|uniref:hypothetical protein n=1 Tax=Acetobacter malorum TaxID=178901 RepID=UPI001E405E9D
LAYYLRPISRVFFLMLCQPGVFSLLSSVFITSFILAGCFLFFACSTYSGCFFVNLFLFPSVFLFRAFYLLHTHPPLAGCFYFPIPGVFFVAYIRAGCFYSPHGQHLPGRTENELPRVLWRRNDPRGKKDS